MKPEFAIFVRGEDAPKKCPPLAYYPTLEETEMVCKAMNESFRANDRDCQAYFVAM